jgi:glycosyltransferase involved in cell wall biosynthesis
MDHLARAHKVTALVPVKNGESYLDNLMPQIISNTNPSDEIIMINDHSTDNTKRELLKWNKELPNLRILDSSKPGLVNALNLGLRESSNTWIARFDVDDNYDSARLSKQIESIQANDVAIFSDYSIKSENKRNLGTIYSPVNPLACSISLINSERTAHPSALINKDAAWAVGGYLNSDFLVEDLSLWLRLSRVGNLRSVPETLLHYTLSKSSVSGRNYGLMLQNKTDLLKRVPVNPNHVKEVQLDYQETLYRDIPNPGIRHLLFMRDIITVCSFNGEIIDASMLRTFAKILLKNPNRLYRDSISLFSYKIFRDNIRRFPIRS